MAEGTHSENFTAGFDYNFGFGFYAGLKSMYNSNASAQLIDALNVSEYAGAVGDQQVVRYITNHDVNGSDGTPLELFTGKKGSLAAFIPAAYMKGVPMIYNGQEVGFQTRITFPFTSVKIDWTINPDVTADYKKLLAFRNSSTALRQGSLTSYSNADVCAFTKELAGQKILVLVNLRNAVISYPVPMAIANTTWADALNGGSVTVGTQVSLQPFGYYVLK